MLVKDTWIALSLRVLSSGVSGMRVSSKKPWEGKLRIVAMQPNEIERTKAGKPNHHREGLTETQTRRPNRRGSARCLWKRAFLTLDARSPANSIVAWRWPHV